MKIIDAADYILGRKFTKELKKEPYRGNSDTLELGKKMLNRHFTAQRNLELIDSHKMFYKMEPDMHHEIPANMREEVFYSLKMDRLSPIIPAKALFLIEKCYSTYNTLNLLPRVFPKTDLDDLFAKGYIAEGYCLRDVLCSLYDEQYRPLELGTLVVPNKSNWDIYIKETDTVAIIPSPIKEKLTHDDISRLTVTDKGITLGDRPIKFLGNYVGAVNSTYDLTGLV